MGEKEELHQVRVIAEPQRSRGQYNSNAYLKDGTGTGCLSLSPSKAMTTLVAKDHSCFEPEELVREK